MHVAGACAPEDSSPRVLSVRHTVSRGDCGPLPISGLVDADCLWGMLLKGAAWRQVHHCPPDAALPNSPEGPCLHLHVWRPQLPTW